MRHSFTAAELVAHADGVRALARSLLADSHAAEDVVQEACLAALTRPPDASTPPRAWFIGVVRNLARRTHRSDAGRMRRERAAARPEATSSGDLAVAQLETHRRLVEAVMDLRDPYRTAVVLRFFGGLAPHEIADRLDVPAATVNTWVHRGLATLRGRLESDRDDWRAALLPLFAIPRKAVPPLVPVAGAIAMTAKKTLVLVAVLLLFVGGALVVRESAWRKTARRYPDGATATAAPVAPRRRALVESGRRPTPGGSTDSATPTASAELPPAPTIAPAPPSGLMVAGRVTRSDGTPFGGAAVHAGPQGRGAVLAASAADGSFSFHVDGAAVTISATADRFYPSDDAAIDGSTNDVTLSVTTRAGALEGTVRAPDGTPAALATVRVGEESHDPGRPAGAHATLRHVTDWTVDTDDSGRWRVEPLPVGTHHVLVAARGAAIWHGSAEIRAGETSRLDVTIGEGASLVGVVRLASGAVAGGIRISIDELGGPRTSVTAADGSYSIANVTPGPSLAHANGGAAGYAEKGLRFGESGETRWDPVLAAGPTVRGRLVDESGAPLRGWQVRLQAPHPRLFFFGETKTDDDGRFEFTQKDGGEFTIEFSEKRGALPIVSRTGVRADGADLVFVAATRDRPKSVVTGRVLDPNHHPLPGAYVQMLPPDRRSLGDAKSGADGRFRIEGVPPGTYTMTAWTKELAILRCGTHAVATDATLDVGDFVFAAPVRVTVRFPEFARDRVAYCVDDDGHDSQPYYSMAHYVVGRKWRGDDEIRLPPGRYMLRWSGNMVMGGDMPIEIVAGGDVVVSPDAVEASAHPMIYDPPVGDIEPKVVYALIRDSAGRMVSEVPIGRNADGDFADFPFLVAGTYTVEARSDTERVARQSVKIEGNGGPSAPAIHIALK